MKNDDQREKKSSSQDNSDSKSHKKNSSESEQQNDAERPSAEQTNEASSKQKKEEERLPPTEKMPIVEDDPVSDKDREKISRYVLLGLLVFSIAAFIPVMHIFFVPLILATTFTTLFFPLYRWLLRVFKNKKGFSSFMACLVLFLGLLIPAYVIIDLVVDQMIDLYTTAEPRIREMIQQGEDSKILQRLQGSRIVQWLQLTEINWGSVLQEAAQRATVIGTTIINRTSAGVFGFVFNIFVVFFTMFYFFMDGERLINRLKYLSPLRNKYENMIISRFLLISRATVLGTLIIGLTQGSLGGLSLLIFGVETWLLWGFIMVILSIIPMVGAWLILLPAAIIKIIIGDVWQGIGIFLVSTVVISNIDNLIRPRLVGRGAKMHDLLIFFSTLGGLSLFGVMGFIVGPVIAALFVSVVDIYGSEFKEQLHAFENK